MSKTNEAKRWGKRLGIACLLFSALVLGGCDKSAKELMLEADSALQSGNIERAEQSLAEAEKKDSETYQAPILRAQIFSAKKEYEKAEQALTALWTQKKLEDDKLSTEQKRYKQLMEEQYFPDLYQAWGDSIDAKANPQKYEEVLKKGLKYDLKDIRMNTMLVTFYQAQGERLVEQKKKVEAAEVFEKIGGLYTDSKKRSSAQERATKLREEVLVEGIAQRFDQELKPTMVTAGLYDATNKLVLFYVEGSIEKRGTPEEALAAADPLLAKQINDAAIKIAGISGDVKLGAPTKVAEFFKIVESEFKRGDYKVKASFPEAQLKAYARELVSRDQKAKAAKADDKKDANPAGDKKAPGKDAPAKDAPAKDAKPAADKPAPK